MGARLPCCFLHTSDGISSQEENFQQAKTSSKAFFPLGVRTNPGVVAIFQFAKNFTGCISDFTATLQQ